MASKKGLIVVDVQNDFLPGGSLAVTGGDEILPTVYELVQDESFAVIVASKDWHPSGHVSFASTHDAELFSVKQVPRLHGSETVAQVMWPDHCVQNSHGSELEVGLQAELDKVTPTSRVAIVEKGTNPGLDSYSAFADNEYSAFTSMARILHVHGVEEVHIVGLATDFCVRATAIDARKFGFKTVVHVKGMRAVDGSRQQTVLDELRDEWGCLVTD